MVIFRHIAGILRLIAILKRRRFQPFCLPGHSMKVPHRQRVIVASLILIAATMLLGGCAAIRPGRGVTPDLQTEYQRIKDRIMQRRDSTRTASYRIRWRARKIEPHAEIILRVDYQAPNRYHMAGKGPMDIPVFTAWVVDSQYVLLEHRGGQTQTGHLGDLRLEESPINVRPFAAFWKLFAGGCGVSLPDSFVAHDSAFRRTDRKNFVLGDDEGRTLIMGLQKCRLKRIEWRTNGPEADWDLQVRFGRFADRYPFWELRSARWINREGPGEYEWEVLAQRYNHDLPDRLFIPPGSKRQ